VVVVMVFLLLLQPFDEIHLLLWFFFSLFHIYTDIAFLLCFCFHFVVIFLQYWILERLIRFTLDNYCEEIIILHYQITIMRHHFSRRINKQSRYRRLIKR
jgi:hypothetical protein